MCPWGAWGQGWASGKRFGVRAGPMGGVGEGVGVRAVPMGGGFGVRAVTLVGGGGGLGPFFPLVMTQTDPKHGDQKVLL